VRLAKFNDWSAAFIAKVIQRASSGFAKQNEHSVLSVERRASATPKHCEGGLDIGRSDE
jgi:hypothetical protein